MSDAAACLAARWGRVASLRLVSHRENAVYDLRLAGGARLALRLHRFGYQDDTAIAAEMDWTAALAAAGFPCPVPVGTGDGWIARAGEMRATAVGWIEGRAFETPDAHDMRRLGALVARLHDAPPHGAFQRPDWTSAAFVGPNPIWGRFWENPSLDAAGAGRLRAARASAAAHLAAGPWPTGAIHADLLTENVLRADGGGLALIDFDDCGTGPLAYDLGTALVQHWSRPDYAELKAAFIEGYGRAPDPDPFVALRALASAGWTIGRFARDDPRHAAYADRALAIAGAVFGV